MRLLVVEDYEPLRDSIVQGLREAGYAVDAASNGNDGLWHAESNHHDVIILDLMLPGIDGLSILKALREQRCSAHFLILTARGLPSDRVLGLDMGADDYLAKPFDFAELLARIRALIRRKYEIKGNVLQVGALCLDVLHGTVQVGGQNIQLNGREYALLEYLAANSNRIVSRSDIWNHVYDFNASAESNVIDVHIARLRKKLSEAGCPRLIQTYRGRGYMLGVAGDAT